MPIRYVMAILGSIGLAIIYALEVNLSIAISRMVNHTAVDDDPRYRNVYDDDDDTENLRISLQKIQDGPFIWWNHVQGQIVSAYFIGYVVSLIPSGIIIGKLSPRWVMNMAVILNAVASVLSPAAADLSPILLGIMRFIQGFGGGVSFPAMHVMIAKWAPPNERNIIGSIIYAGTALGTGISILLTGLIAHYLKWQSVFYIAGLSCLIWCTAWWLLIQDSPADQKRFISVHEKTYILNSLGNSDSGHCHGNQKIPLKKVFTSMPFIAILVAHFCNNCGWYMLLTQLPIYMNHVLHLNFEKLENSRLSSIPYFCMWLFTLILSYILTKLQGNGTITMTLSRKIGTLFSSVVPMFCLIILCFVKKSIVAVALMAIAVIFTGGMYCGFLANHIDIAPNFAGTLIAITNAIATIIPGIAVPIIVDCFVPILEQSICEWKMIFFFTAIFYAIGFRIYWVFGTAVEQPWNNVDTYEISHPTQTLPLKENEK